MTQNEIKLTPQQISARRKISRLNYLIRYETNSQLIKQYEDEIKSIKFEVGFYYLNDFGLLGIDCELNDSAQRVCDKFKSRKHRYFERIKNIVSSGNAIFVTLTFTNEVLNDTCENYRCRLVKQWLNENCIDYVANKDIGAINEREHYHCIVKPKENKLNNNSWKYGCINFKKVKSKNEKEIVVGSKKISCYMAKLWFHSFKDTAVAECRIIYSRKKKGV